MSLEEIKFVDVENSTDYMSIDVDSDGVGLEVINTRWGGADHTFVHINFEDARKLGEWLLQVSGVEHLENKDFCKCCARKI